MTPADWYLTAFLLTALALLVGMWVVAWREHRADCPRCSRWTR